MQLKDLNHVCELRDQFLSGISNIKNLQLNSDLKYSVPHILNLRFEGMLADAILKQLPQLMASTASACQGKGTEGSYVLRAMGLSEEQSKSSVRFSFGRFTTKNEITIAVNEMNAIFKS